MKPMVKSYPVLALFAIACILAGSSGSFFTYPNIATWYASLEKPFFTPPNWMFGPAWTTLFVLMGISIYLVWEKTGFRKDGRMALYLFVFQFALNILWSFLFFGLRSPLLGIADIVPLWLSILACVVVFGRIRRWAGYFMVPYLAWVTFATALNVSVWLLN